MSVYSLQYSTAVLEVRTKNGRDSASWVVKRKNSPNNNFFAINIQQISQVSLTNSDALFSRYLRSAANYFSTFKIEHFAEITSGSEVLI